MERYVAFLRAVNLGGKTKVSMSELKAAFADMGFEEVLTILNSGNVLFSAKDTDKNSIRSRIENRLCEEFGFEIPVYITELEVLRNMLEHMPSWWNTDNKEYYHNLVFILSEDSPNEICDLIGVPSEGNEYVEVYGEAVFWSYDLSCYQKCNWWKKTATKGIAEKLTIRTGNTIKKICNAKGIGT